MEKEIKEVKRTIGVQERNKYLSYLYNLKKLKRTVDFQKKEVTRLKKEKRSAHGKEIKEIENQIISLELAIKDNEYRTLTMKEGLYFLVGKEEGYEEFKKEVEDFYEKTSKIVSGWLGW